MEAYTPLSLGIFIGLTTYCAVSASVSRRHTSVVNSSSVKKAFFNEDADSGYRPKVFIPNTLANWPWSRRINPHHDEATKESIAWMNSLCALSPKGQQAFNRCNHTHAASLMFPTAKKEHIRACCDYMNLAFFVDEYSDLSEPSEVQEQKDIIMDALRNPHKPRQEGEWIGGEMARQFWELTIRDASKESQKRFIMTFDEFLQGVIQEAIDRSGDRIRGIKSYLDVRRCTVGVRPLFALLQLALEIPDEVMSHPAIQEMTLASIDMISIDNDIVSYNIEQSRGDGNHNIVTIVMNELGTDVNGAMLWAQDFHAQLEQKFLAAMERLPEWDEPLNSQVKEYCDGMAHGVRGNDDWQFESERYLGKRGPEIKKKRWVSLLPRMCKSGTKREVGPVLADSSLL